MIAKRAFTLIELLVVMSIIAVMVALLLPAVSKARSMANTTRCSGQVRQMAMAQFAHASDQNGAFSQGTPSHPGINGDFAAWAMWNGHSGPIKTGGWAGIGLLWRQGYLTSLEVAYCTAWTPPYYQYGDAQYGFSPNPANASGHSNIVSWAYHYRSAMDADDDNPRPPNLNEDDATDPFLVDAFSPIPSEAFGSGYADEPAKRYAHGNGYNIAYLDGSIIFLVDANDVVSNNAPEALEHAEQEAEIWEPYFEKDSGHYLNGPFAGTTYTGDGDEDE